jgi:MFS superfamily sulfate permease-like transporter
MIRDSQIPGPSQLDDPDYSAFAWGRYKRLMWWMTLASALSVGLALLFLKWLLGEIPWVMAAFTALGVFASVLLAAALMGLVFLSSGSGHDDVIINPADDML